MNLAFANLLTNLLHVFLIGCPLYQATLYRSCHSPPLFLVVQKFSQARKLVVDSKHNELCLLVIVLCVCWLGGASPYFYSIYNC